MHVVVIIFPKQTAKQEVNVFGRDQRLVSWFGGKIVFRGILVPDTLKR